ncbi:MAG TPA: MBL fold metallo-hydrolase [Ignavibacteria bacterium]|nr:MBL fold metallo-hydrolase [Bacteroidota bacterium]HRI84881.1 MBL fold metallo-hydrolase [Ignavibacteria bacterium]HRJ99008.1 MBL fold metallo-hydrolase [Ignavibacteria bacterium]
MKIGEYKLYPVQTGLFKLDGGAMFGVVPKNLWQKTNPSDEQNRIDMCTRALLLVSSSKKILIDTGIGYKLSEKVNKIYDVDYSEYTLEKSLADLGFNKSDITDVILTHLHFDHAGGSTEYNESKEPVPAFPNAVYYVQKKQYEWALNPTERDRASFFPENYKPLENHKVLNLIEGEKKFDEYITLLPVNGHTNHMQLVKISDDINSLLYLADLIPTAGHIPAPYIMGYDLFPLTTLEEKNKYLAELTKNETMIFFEHDPHNLCGKTGMNEKGYFLKEKFYEL